MSDRVRTPDDDETAAVGIAASGMLALVLGWILDSGALRMLGLLATIAGGALYARGKLTERSEKIEAATSHIRSELDELDPVARAQVIQGLARS